MNTSVDKDLNAGLRLETLLKELKVLNKDYVLIEGSENKKKVGLQVNLKEKREKIEDNTEKVIMVVSEHLVRKDVRGDLRRDIGIAVAHFLWEGYCDTPSLTEYFQNLGLLCPWDGRPHKSELCEEKVRQFKEEEKK